MGATVARRRLSLREVAFMTVRPLRVLSLDGGGMRGTYTATYLACLAADLRAAAECHGDRRGQRVRFDSRHQHRRHHRMCSCVWTVPKRPRHVSTSSTVPRSFHDVCRSTLVSTSARTSSPEKETWSRGPKPSRWRYGSDLGRKPSPACTSVVRIALAITAVELSQHRSWVFKTPHLAATTNHGVVA